MDWTPIWSNKPWCKQIQLGVKMGETKAQDIDSEIANTRRQIDQFLPTSKWHLLSHGLAQAGLVG